MSRANVWNGVKIALVVFIVVILLLELSQSLSLAQDVTEEPTLVVTDPAPEPTAVVTPPPTDEPPPVEEPPEETPVTTPEELLGQLFALLKDAVYIAWASAGVVIFVGLLKTIFQFSGQVAVFVTLGVQVLIWLGYAIANYFGAGEVFQRGYLIVVDIARSLLPLVGSIFAGHVLYKAAAHRNVPVLGYRVPDKDYKQPNDVGVKSADRWTPPPPSQP